MPASYVLFTDRKRQTNAADVVARSARCISLAETGVLSGDAHSKAVFKKWFGFIIEKDGKDLGGIVPNVIARMNYYIKKLPLVVEDAGGTLGPTTNAMATHFQSGDTKSYQARDLTAANPGVKIQLTDIFFNNLKRVESDDQTQIETFIHELSHVAAGTMDMDRHPTNPQPCYGRVAAIALATNFPEQARNNAENYGFYIAEIGGEVEVGSAKAPAGSGRKWAVVQAPTLIR